MCLCCELAPTGPAVESLRTCWGVTEHGQLHIGKEQHCSIANGLAEQICRKQDYQAIPLLVA